MESPKGILGMNIGNKFYPGLSLYGATVTTMHKTRTKKAQTIFHSSSKNYSDPFDKNDENISNHSRTINKVVNLIS